MAVPHQDPEAKPGCFSRFLRLLLCAPQSNHAPPIESQTHSFQPNKPMPNTNPTIPTPGVVARLMGLDSLPNTTRVSKRVAPESVPRSKSVNFVDYLLHFEEPGRHRRVRTSSFREVPPTSSFQQQNNHHDIVVLLLNDDDINSKSNTRQRKKEEEEMKKKMMKKKKISKLKNEARRENYSNEYRNSNGSRTRKMGKEEAFVEPRFKKSVKKKKKKKKMESSECCSENLSPVSVLDAGDDFTFPNETRLSGVEEERGRSNEGNMKETEYWSELVITEKLVKLTEDEIRESDLRGKKRMFESESYEEMCVVFERTILDLLLREFVHQLVEY